MNKKAKLPIEINVPDTEVLTSNDETTISLYDRIAVSEMFIIFAGEYYARSLLNGSKTLNEQQIAIATELNKSTIIVIDSSMPFDLKIELEDRFSKLNIVKSFEYNFTDLNKKTQVTEEINTIIEEYIKIKKNEEL